MDILSADKNAGAASSYDLAIVDEIGLLAEKDRPLVNSMRSSVGAKRGKFLSLSVMGRRAFLRRDCQAARGIRAWRVTPVTKRRKIAS